ncbi:MAG: hypothetical protein FWH28_00540 [Clostridiales bacterium]|nr:hypothetical protein [Clostridiales bacterium]
MIVKMKKSASLLLALLFVLSLFAAPVTAGQAEPIPERRILKSFTLVGAFDGERINNIPVSKNLSAFLWNSKTGNFEAVEATAKTIVGNFVQIWETTGDSNADELRIVSWEDSKTYWDSDMHWDDDIDDEGVFSGAYEWRIPFGQRLLEEYGADGATVDYSNILAYGDLEDSTYWPLHDYYNSASGGSLTMLKGFRTTQQATGWTCGPTSALMVLDWFGLRGDLNEQDLSSLRQHPRQTGATNLQQMINIFDGLTALHAAGIGEWGEWEILSSYDFLTPAEAEEEEEEAEEETEPSDERQNLMSVEELMDGSLFQELLSRGIPILIGWNSFGGHWQVIIGYDDRGSEDTKDHVLILADPYDTTDHYNDGYNVQSLERFVFDWSAGFDPDFDHGVFLAAVPLDWVYEAETGEGITAYKEGYDGDAGDGMKLDYGRAAADLERYYPATPWRGDNGLAGAATGGYERVPNDFVNLSPYYAHYDFYQWKNGESPVGDGELIILENFKTRQQTTEWTCGLTSALMAIDWFDANPGLPKLLNAVDDTLLMQVAGRYELDPADLMDDSLSEINLALLRGEGRQAPGATTLDDMMQIFDSLNEDELYLQAIAAANEWDTLKKWAYLSTDDLIEGCITDEEGVDHYLEDGAADDGLIPYYLSLGYPVLIGWNEWGGHWQVVIGYDDLGTEETPDDVLILADPYDTTDHNQDGYYLESFERLVYGWVADFDARGDEVFLIPYLIDTEIPARPATAPKETLSDILSLLSAPILIPNADTIGGSASFLTAVKAFLLDQGYTAGLDYTLDDAAVLQDSDSDVDCSMQGHATMTLRVRCGSEMATILVTISSKADIFVTDIVPGNNQANLNFMIRSANGKGYTTYLSETGTRGSFKPYTNVNYNANGVHIRGLVNGKTYYAYIEYINENGGISKSQVVALP